MANLIVTIDGPAASGKSTVARLLAERLDASFLDTGAMYRAVTLAAMQASADMSNQQMLLEVLNKRKFQFAVRKNPAGNSKMTASIDGVDVTEKIRGQEVTENAKYIAEAPKIREKLVEIQRQLAAGEDKIVTEGRDQGTVAFPNANIKFYLTAQASERARRRAKEESERKATTDYADYADKIKNNGSTGSPSRPATARHFAETRAKSREKPKSVKSVKSVVSKERIEQIQRDIEERDRRDQNRTVGPLTPAADAVVIDTTDLTIEEVVSRLEFIVRSSSAVGRPQAEINHERFDRPPLGVPRTERLTWRKPSPSGVEGLPTMNNEQPKMIWFRFARWLCKIFCMTFFRLHPAGRENVPDHGPLVLICNHQSFLDPVLCGIFVKRPLYFLARDSLFRGFFGRLIASVNTIPVKRGTADLASIKTIIKKLKEGNGVCLFPEATRSNDGKITPFKPGFGLLCRRGGAAVVPVLIDGAFECWPRHKKLFSPGGHIAIHYGKCIPAGKVKKMDDRKLAELLTDTLRRMQNDCRLNQGKKPYDY